MAPTINSARDGLPKAVGYFSLPLEGSAAIVVKPMQYRACCCAGELHSVDRLVPSDAGARNGSASRKGQELSQEVVGANEFELSPVSYLTFPSSVHTNMPISVNNSPPKVPVVGEYRWSHGLEGFPWHDTERCKIGDEASRIDLQLNHDVSTGAEARRPDKPAHNRMSRTEEVAKGSHVVQVFFGERQEDGVAD